MDLGEPPGSRERLGDVARRRQDVVVRAHELDRSALRDEQRGHRVLAFS